MKASGGAIKMTEDYSLQYTKENKKVLNSSITDGKEKEEEKTAFLWPEVLVLERLRLHKL